MSNKKAHLRSDRNPGHTESLIPYTSGKGTIEPGDSAQLRCVVLGYPEGTILTVIRYRGLGRVQLRAEDGGEFSTDLYKLTILKWRTDE